MTRVVVASAGEPVIRKEPLGTDAAARLRHEATMLERLRGVPGVCQIARVPARIGSILLVDIDGVALRDVNMPLDPADVAGLAFELAGILAAVHARGVLHGDVNPANIVVSRSTGITCLIDFSRATRIGPGNEQFMPRVELRASLAYLAPEQTGRTGRPVDHRADLYGLGATLYELAVGEAPFTTSDLLRLSHDQLATTPVSPYQRNPAVPLGLSDIIMRLLEKEPDRRYQTADSLKEDLDGLRESMSGWFDRELGSASATATHRGLASHDVALRATSRLVGRDAEVAALSAAFLDAVEGKCRGILVSGAAGTGKSSLVRQLRPVVMANDGWFVVGKFDQYRGDEEFDAVRQAMRELGRLLLTEPEEKLTELRRQMLDALGANANLAASAVPELSALLRVKGDASLDDQLAGQDRLAQAGVDLLRVIARPQRPIAFVLDDLQWAQRTALRFIDAVFAGPPIEGLLIVGAYRAPDVDAAHPLGLHRERWVDLDVAPREVKLGNLSAFDLASLVADMLGVEPPAASDLANAVAPRTMGNPFDTVELLSALRRDGVLRREHGDWHWDLDAVRRYPITAGVPDLLIARVDRLPAPTRTVLEQMACLGGQADLALVQAATGLDPEVLREQLAPAIAEDLVQLEPGPGEILRFRHDLIPEALLGHMERPRQDAMRLALARRLGEHPSLLAVAAEQYLPVVHCISDQQEAARVVALLRAAADQAMSQCYYTTVEQVLSAALTIFEADDPVASVDMETGRLIAFYSLGQLEQADQVFRRIRLLDVDPLLRNQAILTQVSSLTNRGMLSDALSLGLEQLRRLGMHTPTRGEMENDTAARLDELYAWASTHDAPDSLFQPQTQDPTVIAMAAMVNRLMPTVFFGDRGIMHWLCLQAISLWRERGPTNNLAGPAAHFAFVAIGLRGGYDISHKIMRMLLTACEAYQFRPGTALVRFIFSASVGQWFEPLRENVRLAQLAREELVQGGDLQNGCYAYYPSIQQSLEFAPSLDSYAVEVESAKTFAMRTGNSTAAVVYRAYRRLVRELRGEAEPPGRDAELELYTRPFTPGGDRNTIGHVQLTRAIAAALFGRSEELQRHTETAVGVLPALDASYPTVLVSLLRGIALCDRMRNQADGYLSAEVDALLAWLAGRAEDAPENYLHLVHLLEAERAWALGDFHAAVIAFDSALEEVALVGRPWHHGYILERDATFCLANDMVYTGRQRLREARRVYDAWGATGKVDGLDRDHPFLVEHAAGLSTQMATSQPRSLGSLPTESIDLLAILEASRALSSEKSLEGLQSRVVEVLSAMTGATTVHIVLWDDDAESWVLPDTDRPIGRDAQRELPLSVIRYVERTREALIVPDATNDDRFARDPYLSELTTCSLLVVPIVNRGELQALLLLENRLIRSAFSTENLDGVMLIAGQLAVSLDNATIYSSMERKVADRTRALAVANERLELLSITDPLTKLANRRRLEEVLVAQWRQASRSRQPIAVAMVDVDHFKPYNDRYGHPAGDEILRKIATTLRKNVRDTDLAARYGGEEFAIVMPNTDIVEARHVAERLRASIESLHDRHAVGVSRAVTVSVGVAAMHPTPQRRYSQLIDLADDALYHAKSAGRNRVEVA